MECQQYLDAGLVGPATKKLNELFTKAADATLKTKATRKTTPCKFKHKAKPKKWFDEECRLHRNKSRKLAIQKQQNPNDIDIRRLHSAALKDYKKICATKKLSFEQHQIQEMEKTGGDCKEFWKSFIALHDIGPVFAFPIRFKNRYS